jgi:hypothetical protein
VLDGNAYTTRPGPRIVDGAERLRAMILDHPLPGMMRWTPAASGVVPLAGKDFVAR